MPFGPEHERWADCTGAYVLGALGDEDREGFERHLAACEFCREEVEFLAAASVALPQGRPPPELRDHIMSVVDRESALLRAAEGRAPWRERLLHAPSGLALLAWAVVLVLAGGLGGMLLAENAAEPVRTVAGSAPTRGTEVRLVIAGGQGRLEVDHLPPPPAGRVYQVWVKRPGVEPEPTSALFVPSEAGSAVAGVPGFLTGLEAVLVTDEPAGGSAMPTGTPAARVAVEAP